MNEDNGGIHCHGALEVNILAGHGSLAGRRRSAQMASRSRNRGESIIRHWPVGLVTGLLVTCVPAALRAESAVTIQDLAAEIQALKAENREMKTAIAKMHGETRRTELKLSQTRRQTPAEAVDRVPEPPPIFTDKKIHLYGVTITPGGRIEGAGLWRSRNEQADLSTSYANIPTLNNNLAHLNEGRFSARATRGSLLIEAPINASTKVSAFGEFDFLGAAQTANSNQTNSYQPRLREAWSMVDWNDWGVHLLVGQSYSLTNLYTDGVTPRKEAFLPTIDRQEIVGVVYKRQPGVRLIKDIGPSLTASISAENPQTTFGTACATANAVGGAVGPAALPPGGNVAQISCAATGATGTFSGTNNFSLNRIPDVIGKLAYDPTFEGRHLHLEAFGIYRNFYDQVSLTPLANGNFHNLSTTGGGVGGGAVFEAVPKLLDIQGNVLWGRGIGSYGAGQLSDVTFNQNGGEAAIPELIFNVGALLHATPSLDVFASYGNEREQSKYFQTGGTFFGYGVPTANNTGCFTNNAAAATCAGSTRGLWEISGGVWDKFYQGPLGEMRAGLQYSYVKKELFSGNGGGAVAPLPASTDDHIVMVSWRYYPFAVFDAPSPAVTAKY